jgi:hypothetical protein
VRRKGIRERRRRSTRGKGNGVEQEEIWGRERRGVEEGKL